MKLSKLAEMDVNLHKADGKKVFCSSREAEKREIHCENCYDGGFLLLKYVDSGPYNMIPTAAKGKVATIGPDGKWYIVETKIYDCPICSDQMNFIANLWDTCGLTKNEQGWRINFIKGMDGKNNALDEAINILESYPTPQGFTTFFGDYSMGKSGILKALVAQGIIMGVPAHYCKAIDMLTEMKNTFKDRSRSERDVMDFYVSRKILAIDELSPNAVNDSTWALSTLRQIIDERYDLRFSKRLTLIATNSDPENFSDNNSEWDYLSERMREGFRIPMTGKNLRGEPKVLEYLQN